MTGIASLMRMPNEKKSVGAPELVHTSKCSPSFRNAHLNYLGKLISYCQSICDASQAVATKPSFAAIPLVRTSGSMSNLVRYSATNLSSPVLPPDTGEEPLSAQTPSSSLRDLGLLDPTELLSVSSSIRRTNLSVVLDWRNKPHLFLNSDTG